MVEVASSHDFPHFSEPPEAQLQLAMKDQQSKFRNDLDFQVRLFSQVKRCILQHLEDYEKYNILVSSYRGR